MPAEDDILLLQLIKQDDEKAFKHLFDTYFVSLCRFMSLYLRDKQEILKSHSRLIFSSLHAIVA